MKLFKRIQAIILAVVLGTIPFATTPVYAAEYDSSDDTSNVKFVESYINEDGCEEVVFDIDPSESGDRSTNSLFLDQTFTMTGTHTGSTRTYYANYVQLTIYITDVYGNTLTDGTILEVRFKNSSGTDIRALQTSSPNTIVPYFGITYGGSYYIKYAIAYGTQTVRVRMVINVQ